MRTETIVKEIFQFSELSEDAKETAREWFREGALDYEWWEFTYEDAENVGLKITSFDLYRQDITGEFLGTAFDTAKQIKADHGPDCETYKTACEYYSELYAFNDEIRESAEYEFKRAILEDYRIILQKEYEWQLADEQVDESIIANVYEFTADGHIY